MSPSEDVRTIASETEMGGTRTPTEDYMIDRMDSAECTRYNYMREHIAPQLPTAILQYLPSNSAHSSCRVNSHHYSSTTPVTHQCTQMLVTRIPLCPFLISCLPFLHISIPSVADLSAFGSINVSCHILTIHCLPLHSSFLGVIVIWSPFKLSDFE